MPSKKLPPTKTALFIRTDFSDQDAWNEICALTRKPNWDNYLANLHYVDDLAFANTSVSEFLDLAKDSYPHTFIILADEEAMSNPEHPLLVVYLYGGPGWELRVIPSQIGTIEANLSTANMGFEDFLDNANDDGIFRGFE